MWRLALDKIWPARIHLYVLVDTLGNNCLQTLVTLRSITPHHSAQGTTGFQSTNYGRLAFMVLNIKETLSRDVLTLHKYVGTSSAQLIVDGLHDVFVEGAWGGLAGEIFSKCLSSYHVMQFMQKNSEANQSRWSTKQQYLKKKRRTWPNSTSIRCDIQSRLSISIQWGK